MLPVHQCVKLLVDQFVGLNHFERLVAVLKYGVDALYMFHYWQISFFRTATNLTQCLNLFVIVQK